MLPPTDFPILRTPAFRQGTVVIAGYRYMVTPSLVEILEGRDWMVVTTFSTAACMEMALKCLPVLFVIDYVPTAAFAIDLLHSIRSNGIISQAGIIVIGGTPSEADEIRALDAGADDYIAPPLRRERFLARAQGLINRARLADDATTLRYADIRMDVARHRVFRNGASIELGPTPYKLLRHFLENPERVFSPEELGDALWGRGAALRTVSGIATYVSLLRRYLKQSGQADPIRTVKGGYCLQAAANEDVDISASRVMNPLGIAS